MSKLRNTLPPPEQQQQPAPVPTHGGVYELVNGALVTVAGGPIVDNPAPAQAEQPTEGATA